MYGNIIDTFPDDNKNPLRFYYDKNHVIGISDYSKRNIITPKVGEIVLKMTVRCIFRTHDGYCSGFEFFGDEDDMKKWLHQKSEICSIYFNIPDEFLDEETKTIRSDILDDDSNIIENEITEIVFKEWTVHSKCNGSGVCNLYDTYIPLKIEYVKITE